MHYVMKTPKPPRPHEILQELRDISSMAMEHFDEKVVPILKKKMPGVVSVPTVVTTAGMCKSVLPLRDTQRSPLIDQSHLETYKTLYD